MLLRTSVAAALLAGALAAVPAAPAYATIEHCPEGVAEVKGTQPTLAQVDAWLTAAAAKHAVPLPVLRVIALKESTWRQFAPNGGPLVSSDAVCGLGLMQVTADDREDAVQLAQDGAYNADVGAGILREKWDLSQTTPPPTGYTADDPDVIENWYYAICLYNGCSGSSDLYAADAAKYLHDPFRYLPESFRAFIRPAGFTKPAEAKPSYVFPSAFQARWTAEGGEFVFYDHTTGTVTDVVPARVHRVSAPPVVSYPAYAAGPDGPGVTCQSCGGWRLWEGAGLSGRAHWTNSVTGETQAQVDWVGFGATAGRYRVDAYVPALGTETLGRATYWLYDFAGPATSFVVDQNARKGGWVTVGHRAFGGVPRVALVDASDVAGQKIVADAVRLVPQPVLAMTLDGPQETTYGGRRGLFLDLTYSNGDPVRYRYVKVYRRPLGTAPWREIGTWRTSSSGHAEAIVQPDRNYEYTARFTPAPGDYLAATASGNVRHLVRPRIAAAFTNNSPLSGDATTLRTSVAPSHAGHAVQFQRWISGTGWRTVAYARLDSYSRAGWTFRPTLNGECGRSAESRYRVYKPADHDHIASASEPVTLLVHARCG